MRSIFPLTWKQSLQEFENKKWETEEKITEKDDKEPVSFTFVRFRHRFQNRHKKIFLLSHNTTNWKVGMWNNIFQY